MGCHSSKLLHADDSIHVMLKHSKKHPEQPSTYVPRAQHPLLQAARENASTTKEDDSDASQDLDRLLYHATNHNDTIDQRDLAEYGGQEEAPAQ